MSDPVKDPILSWPEPVRLAMGALALALAEHLLLKSEDSAEARGLAELIAFNEQGAADEKQPPVVRRAYSKALVAVKGEKDSTRETTFVTSAREETDLVSKQLRTLLGVGPRGFTGGNLDGYVVTMRKALRTETPAVG